MHQKQKFFINFENNVYFLPQSIALEKALPSISLVSYFHPVVTRSDFEWSNKVQQDIINPQKNSYC